MPRTLKVTREGRYYLALTFGVGIAAVNTGNNLLFLSLGMLLALIILSGLLSEAALRKLDVRRVLPREARAGDPVMLGLIVHNGNRLLPSVGLSFEEAGVEGAETSVGRAYRVSAGTTERVTLRLRPRARGELRLGRLRVTTSYPFGIFAKTRTYEREARLVVFPARVAASRVGRGEGRSEVGGARVRRGGGEDFHGLREWRDGDEARMIHWRRTLRVGELVVVEREVPLGRRVRVHLAAGAGDAFEREVCVAAARVERHLAEGDQVALDLPGDSLGYGLGAGHRHRLLTSLALVRGDGRRVEEAA